MPPPSLFATAPSLSPLARINAVWNAATPPPQARSVDLFMILFVSIFLFLTAAVLRLVPWASPLVPRPPWSTRDALSRSAERDALRGYAAFPYGALDRSHDDPFHHRPGPAPPTYETLLEIGDRIGTANHGLTEEQITILPTYRCNGGDVADDDHARRGLYCAICRDKYHRDHEIRVLPCGDEFHADCISPWLRQQATCPLCRCRFA